MSGRVMVTMGAAGGVSTYGYDSNGNETSVIEPSAQVTMSYDKENRLIKHEQSSDGTVATYTYDGDGKKRMELVNGTYATLIWDGEDYLGEA
ncbi:MAG: hypothetical protein HZC36_05190 [Armatimonadetes bacterium]|nr:hypothetical protein [Armatimonadota bacterium]